MSLASWETSGSQPASSAPLPPPGSLMPPLPWSSSGCFTAACACSTDEGTDDPTHVVSSARAPPGVCDLPGRPGGRVPGRGLCREDPEIRGLPGRTSPYPLVLCVEVSRHPLPDHTPCRPDVHSADSLDPVSEQRDHRAAQQRHHLLPS